MRTQATWMIACGLLLTASPLAAAQGADQVGTVQQGAAEPAKQSQDSSAETAFTIDGETALWTVAIKPDKTADFERVLARLREALTESKKPERRRQAEGWKVVRLSTPLPDGNVAYVYVVDPVVMGADYSVMQILYDEFPDERQMLYELYRGAFVRNLSLATGSTVIDMSPGASSAPTGAPPATPQTPPPQTPQNPVHPQPPSSTETPPNPPVPPSASPGGGGQP